MTDHYGEAGAAIACVDACKDPVHLDMPAAGLHAAVGGDVAGVAEESRRAGAAAGCGGQSEVQ